MSDVESFMAGNGWFSRALYQLFRTSLELLCRLWLRLSVEGKENIPRSGAFILAPVHRSYIDTPIACASTVRRMRYMGKDTLWRHQPLNWLLSALGGFPVTRGSADREALKRCIAVLEAGEPLVLFPEGERKSGPVVQPLFNGAAYVACKAAVPIVPVGIGGSERAMPKGRNVIFPRKCHMIIGPPIHPPAMDGGRIPRVAPKEMSEHLHAELQRLFDAAQVRASR